MPVKPYKWVFAFRPAGDTDETNAVTAAPPEAGRTALAAGTWEAGHVIYDDMGTPAYYWSGRTLVSAEAGTLTSVSTTGPERDVWPMEKSVGNDYATIPVTVAGTEGAEVQIRMVDDEFAGANTQAWQPLGTLGSTATTFDWQCPQTDFWGHIECRVAAGDATIVSQAKQLAAGPVLCFGGQSGIMTGLADSVGFYGKESVYPDPVFQPGNVRTFRAAGGGGTVDSGPITEENRINPVHVALANACAFYLPHAKVKLVYIAKVGQGLNILLDDSETNWPWAPEEAMFNDVMQPGSKPGVLLWQNQGALGGFGVSFGTVMSEMMTGRRSDGSLIPPGGALSHGGTSYVLDHTLRDLFGEYEKTAIVNSATRINTRFSIGKLAPSWKAAAETIPHFGSKLSPDHYIEVTRVEYGFPTVDGGWKDGAHPSPYNAFSEGNGACRFHRSLLEVALAGYGYIDQPVMLLNESTFSASNNYVELGITGQTITTIRDAHGETLPAGERQVHGFTFNGVVADAIIVGGKIRVLKPGGALITVFDSVDVETSESARVDNGLTREEQDTLDRDNRKWMSWPTVIHPAGGLTDGIPIQVNATPASVFKNTLPVQVFPVRSDTNILANNHTANRAYTMKIVAKILSNSGFDYMIGTTSSDHGLLVNDGGIIISISGQGNETAGSAYTTGVFHEFTLVMDPVSGKQKLFVSLPGQAPGPAKIDRSLAPWVWNTGLQPRFFGGNGGGGLNADIVSVKIWHEYSANGTDPVSAPYKVITGSNLSEAVASTNATPAWEFRKNGIDL